MSAIVPQWIGRIERFETMRPSSDIDTDNKVWAVTPKYLLRKFGPNDIQVGHVRRYEKVQLHALLEKCGFADITILNYGLPLGNLTRTVRNMLHRRETHDIDHVDAVVLSERSRPESILKLSLLFRKSVLRPFLIMRRWTWRLDWGDGYVVTTEKTAHGQS